MVLWVERHTETSNVLSLFISQRGGRGWVVGGGSLLLLLLPLPLATHGMQTQLYDHVGG